MDQVMALWISEKEAIKRLRTHFRNIAEMKIRKNK